MTRIRYSWTDLVLGLLAILLLIPLFVHLGQIVADTFWGAF
jgi:hypothetical protein